MKKGPEDKVTVVKNFDEFVGLLKHQMMCRVDGCEKVAGVELDTGVEGGCCVFTAVLPKGWTVVRFTDGGFAIYCPIHSPKTVYMKLKV